MKELLIILTILNGADTATTIYNVKHGAVEKNPALVRLNAPMLVGVMTGKTIAQWALINNINESHPKLARTLVGVSIGVSGFAVTWNLTKGRPQLD